MKFVYEYRTGLNERRRGQISASDREAAFSALKKEGIRPAKMDVAPGFFNAILSCGVGRLALSAIVVVLCVALWFAVSSQSAAKRVLTPIDSMVRRQILGDVAFVEKGIRDGWANVFSQEGDRFLASFAIPGRSAGVRNTTVEAISDALEHEVSVRDSDTLEARQIKLMVEGMKNELRRFLDKGGTIPEYGEELVRRQDLEISYYNRAKTEIDSAADAGVSIAELDELWERRNSELRAMGICPVPYPEKRELAH